MSVEGSYIRPDRSLIQGAVFHARSQYRCGIRFPLDMSEDVAAGYSELEPKLESANPGA
ncbi:MAG: hypothetical protein NUW01_13680 [Gemmatimonadaceae bacterium]|nr:hypothetical protein [Gemmatimonadaceae bacterium]